MPLTGYSGTPLAKKLGIKEGTILRLFQEPANYFDLFTNMPAGVKVVRETTGHKDIVHFFTKDIAELDNSITSLRKEIFPGGMIWVSWPKRASKVETNVTEDLVRNIALRNGLVDVKVCAIDETWSGLKLVVPVKDRK